MRFIQVNNIFWSLEALNYLLPIFIIDWKYEFQLEVSKNKIVIFFPIQVHRTPEIYPWTS